MKSLLVTLILLTGLTTHAASGISETRVQVLKRGNQAGADLLADVLSSYSSVITEKLTVKFHDPNTGKVSPQAPTTITITNKLREEPDAPAATNFMIIDGDIFQIGGLDIEKVEMVNDDTLKITGSAGDIINSGKACGNFSGVHRELTIQFSRENFELKAKVIAQKSTNWCS